MPKNLIDNNSLEIYEGVEKSVYDAQVPDLISRMNAAEANINMMQAGSVLLFGGSKGVGETITLTEPFTNFRYLLFVSANHGSALVLVGYETEAPNVDTVISSVMVGRWFGVSMNGVYKFSNNNSLYNEFNRCLVKANSATSLTISYGSREIIGTSLSSSGFANVIRVYGVQRVQ